uniref:RNA polymerase Rpb4/RPC9 core domain-containing protein n=1 Tax=Salvator merianae TaxID=96440 RepID=A0A8D0C6A1_SALMN
MASFWDNFQQPCLAISIPNLPFKCKPGPQWPSAELLPRACVILFPLSSELRQLPEEHVHGSCSCFFLSTLIFRSAKCFISGDGKNKVLMDAWAVDVEEDPSQVVFPKDFEIRCGTGSNRMSLHRNTQLLFSCFKKQATIESVCSLLLQKRLFKFELACLANHCPEIAKEAKALILSLESYFEDEELQQILDDIQNQQSFHD